MDRWLIFFNERFPTLSYVLLVAGLTLSSVLSAQPRVVWEPLLVSFLGVLFFFVELRLMDELKNYRKDRVAHPNRPLPRGLLSVQEAQRAVGAMLAVLIFWSVLTWACFGIVAGGCFAFVTVWLWLTYQEFYVSYQLAPRPLAMSLSHYGVLLPLAAYPALCVDPAVVTSRHLWCFAVSVLGAFFSYEVCRKCNPLAHPVLKTYLSVYGPTKTWGLVWASCAVAALGALGSQLPVWLWPLDLALALLGAVLVLRPNRYRVLETSAGMVLMAHLWILVLSRAWSWSEPLRARL